MTTLPTPVTTANTVQEHLDHHGLLHEAYNTPPQSIADPTTNLPLTTLTGWTTHGGTWAVQTDRISQTAAGGADHRNLWLDQSLALPLGEFVIECEILVPAFGIVNTRAGLIVGPRTNTNNGLCFYIEANSSSSGLYRLYVENQAVTARGAKNFTAVLAYNTWHKMRLQYRGGMIEAFVNDVYQYTHPWVWVDYTADNPARVGLANQGTLASYKNFKFWTIDPFRVGPKGPAGPQGNTLVGNTYIAIGPSTPANPSQTPIWVKTS